MIKNSRNAWKEKKLGWILNLLDLKMVDWIINTKNAKNHFPALYKFCNGDLDKFFLLLRKGIYPYEYIDSRKKFNQNTILPKEAFYSELNSEGISDQTMSTLNKYGKRLK